MKKKTLFLLVCISIVLLLTLVSCGEPKSAEALYEKVDQVMNSLNSYEMDMDMKMTFYVSGYKVTGESRGHAVEYGLQGDEYYFYQEVDTKVTCKELSIAENQKNVETYSGGNYFICNESGGASQKLYSALTSQQAMEYRLENDMEVGDVFEDCAERSFEKKEDGTWVLIYSGYTKKAIAHLEESMGLDGGLLDAEIMDMVITCVVDENYYVKRMELEFVFEEESKTPTIEISMTYSAYDAAEKKATEPDVADYTKVDDIRLLTQVEDMLAERAECESGSFTLALTQSVTSTASTSSSLYKETDKVTFGEDESGYFYDIDATVDNVKYDISYKNGKQTVKTSSKTQDNDQTDKEARAYIETLINSAGYDCTSVSKVEKRGEGVYRFTCTPGKDVYESYFANMGGKLTSATQTITVTIKDGQITKIQSVVTAMGSVVNYGTVTLTVNTTVTFE